MPISPRSAAQAQEIRQYITPARRVLVDYNQRHEALSRELVQKWVSFLSGADQALRLATWDADSVPVHSAARDAEPQAELARSFIGGDVWNEIGAAHGRSEWGLNTLRQVLEMWVNWWASEKTGNH